MRLSSPAATAFERALGGDRVTDAEIARLVATTHALAAAVTSVPTPRPEFVTALRERLVAEARSMPVPSPARARAASEARTAARTKPVVLVVGGGLSRALVGAAASAVAVGAVVGVASRSALPGAALYPVKGWLDSVAVQMAASPYDRGMTRLAQAQEHLSDARSLADQGSRDAADYTEALRGATSSLRHAQRDLDAAFAEGRGPRSLLALRDFTARAQPQVEALRTEVPGGALPALRELQSLLGQVQQATGRRLAACAPQCVSLDQLGPSPTDLPSVGPVGATSPVGSAAPTSSAPSTGAVSVTVPGVSVGAPGSSGQPLGPTGRPPGSSAPGSTSGSGGLVGATGGGATLATGGATVGGPSLTASVPVVPGATASVGGPSVTIGTGGVGATLPRTTLGGATLPGVTVKLP